MKTFVVSAALLALGFVTACTSAVDLKQPEQFTRSRITQLRAADACRLASTWKATAQARPIPTERTVGHTSNWLEFGRATVRLDHGPVLKKLREILRLYYQRVPTPMLNKGLVLELQFVRRIGEPRAHVGKAPLRPLGERVVRSDQSIIVRVDGATFRLAYHPCVGELLFGSAPKPRERSTMSDKLHDVL